MAIFARLVSIRYLYSNFIKNSTYFRNLSHRLLSTINYHSLISYTREAAV